MLKTIELVQFYFIFKNEITITNFLHFFSFFLKFLILEPDLDPHIECDQQPNPICAAFQQPDHICAACW